MENNNGYVDNSVGAAWFATNMETGEARLDKNGQPYLTLSIKKDIAAGTKIMMFRTKEKKTDKSPDFTLLPKNL